MEELAELLGENPRLETIRQQLDRAEVIDG
jgi:hypothetical protein